jgi:hypothetical protein
VLENELLKGPSPPPSVGAFLHAKIGCCSDFAYLTKSLLDHEGYVNRLTTIPGHVFNEVLLDGRWCIVDATTNMFIDMSWEELYSMNSGHDRINVLLFPHASMSPDKACQYRSRVGQFRLMMLLRVANHPEQCRKVEHPDLPSYFD